MIAADWMWGQLWQLSVSILAGLVLGFCYDIYRGILARERRFRQDYWWRDLLFGLCVILLALLLWFGLTDGSLRLSVFVWMAAATLFYRWLLSPFLHPEKWMRRKTKGPAGKEKKKSKKKSHKKPRQWNIKAARKTILAWRQLQNKLHQQNKEPGEEKI